MSNVTRYLIGLRLRWYFHSLRQFEVKFRQALILIVGLGPGLVLVAVVPYIVKAIFMANTNVTEGALSLLLYEIVCLLWVVCFADAIKGNPLDRFVRSLPLSKRRCYGIDLVVLFIANFVAWAILAIGICLIPAEELAGWRTANVGFRIVILLALTLTVQMIWLRGPKLLLVSILPMGYFFVASNLLHSYLFWLSTAAIGAAIFLVNAANLRLGAVERQGGESVVSTAQSAG